MLSIAWVALGSRSFNKRASPELTKWLIWQVSTSLNSYNMVLLMYFKLLEKNRIVYQLIATVSGHCALVEQHESLVGIRWRKMILLDEYVQYLYSVKILRIPITYDAIMSFDTSIYGALLHIYMCYLSDKTG